MKHPRDVFPVFRYNPLSGITNWLMPFYEGNRKYFGVYPMKSTSHKTTTLTKPITDTDTTIYVNDTTGFVNNNGRITIGGEKIQYAKRETGYFSNCIRGLEMTSASNHNAGVNVDENNLWFFYSRLPIDFTASMHNDSEIPASILGHEIEVFDEHLEGIFDATAYRLLSKIDAERAVQYKQDYELMLEQYKKDIRKGSYRGRMGANVRLPNAINENSNPFGAQITY
jgi:hypothetical protein